MIRNHVHSIGLALLALAVGLAAGCGGESGGLPSGIGGSLQGARITSTFVSLNLGDSSLTEDTSITPDVIVGLTGTRTQPTDHINLVLKGAGVSQKDVVARLDYIDPTPGALDPSIPEPARRFTDSNDSATSVSTTAQRVYLVNLPSTGVEFKNERFLIGLRTPSNRSIIKSSGYTTPTSQFIFKGVIPTFSDATLRTAWIARRDSVLNAINNSVDLQRKTLDGLALDGVDGYKTIPTVQYQPNNIQLRKGTFDVAVEFYTAPPVGETTSPPFFISYLKGAAVFNGGDVTILPTRVAAEDAFDPARRFARPVESSVKLTGLPLNTRALRIRIAEANLSSETLTTFERVFDLHTGALYDPITGKLVSPTYDATVIFINRLRKVALQAEAYLQPANDASGNPPTLDQALAGAPVAIGRLTESNSGTLTPTPELQEISFADCQLRTRIPATNVGTGVFSYFVNPPLPATLVPGFPVSTNLYANLEKVNADIPFTDIGQQTLLIPSTDQYITAYYKKDADPDYTLIDGTSDLRLEKNNNLIFTTAAPFDPKQEGSVKLNVDLPTKSPSGSDSFESDIDLGVASATTALKFDVSNLPFAGGPLAKSLKIKARDEGDDSAEYLLIVPVGSTPNQDISIPVIKRDFEFIVEVEAYSGENGSGALLSGTSVPFGNIVITDAPVTIPLVSKAATFGVTYSGTTYPGTQLIRGETYVPRVTIGGVEAPADLFTFSAPANTTTGELTVTTPSSINDTPISVVATYKGEPATTGGDKTATANRVVGPDQFSFTATNPTPAYGSLRFSLTEVGGAGVYTDTSTSVLTKTFTGIQNRQKPYAPKLQLWSNDDGTGVLLAEATDSNYAFTTATSTLSANIGNASANRVTAVAGATVGGFALEGYAFTRGKDFEIVPILTVAGSNVPVPIKIVKITTPNNAGGVIAPIATGVRVNATPNSSTSVNATIRIDYLLNGETTSSVRTKTFNVTIKPASGGASGTIG